MTAAYLLSFALAASPLPPCSLASRSKLRGGIRATRSTLDVRSGPSALLTQEALVIASKEGRIETITFNVDKALPDSDNYGMEVQTLRTSLVARQLDSPSCFTALPNISKYTSLRTLDLFGCSNLKGLGENLSALTELQVLALEGCSNLTTLPDLSTLRKLHTLELKGCSSLAHLPNLTSNTALQTLDLRDCSSLAELPDLSLNTELRTLDLRGCTALTTLPELSKLTSLRVLYLSDCTSLRSLPDLRTLTALETLDLVGCNSLDRFPELPEHPSLMVHHPAQLDSRQMAG